MGFIFAFFYRVIFDSCTNPSGRTKNYNLGACNYYQACNYESLGICDQKCHRRVIMGNNYTLKPTFGDPKSPKGKGLCKKFFPPYKHGCCQIWPDLGANFPDLARFPDVEILFPDLARSGQIWESGKFFFSKKKKTPQIWPDLEIWPVFFFPQISGYCLPGKGTLEFFFSPLKRANFDDLRPLKRGFANPKFHGFYQRQVDF